MILTVYFDGKFWCGLVEYESDQTLIVKKHIFGFEPSIKDLNTFLEVHLDLLMNANWNSTESRMSKPKKKINPKRLQRMINKEMKQKGISTKSQDILKEELEKKKLVSSKVRSEQLKRIKIEKYQNQRIKKKKKRRGH